jgi:hypothetical protein
MNKLMKKIIALSIVLVLVPTVLTVICLASLAKGVSNVDQEYKDFLGTKVLVGKDSLQITDYDLLERTFTLRDGTQVNSSLVFNKKLSTVK